MRVYYESNESGDKFALSKADWEGLEVAGWSVRWANDPVLFGMYAFSASREGVSLEDVVKEWEHITGKSSTKACACGAVHSFVAYDDDGLFSSKGPTVRYVCEW